MSKFQGFEFDESHIVDYDDLICHNHQWMIVDVSTNGCICIVGAGNEQDAFDEACDGDKLDKYQIPESDVTDDNCEDYIALGNASEWFDLSEIRCIKLPAVTMSYCASFDKQHGKSFAKHADDECQQCGCLIDECDCGR